MSEERHFGGVNNMPVYLIEDSDVLNQPVDQSKWITGVPIHELLLRIPEGHSLFFVNYATHPGSVMLTRLA